MCESCGEAHSLTPAELLVFVSARVAGVRLEHVTYRIVTTVLLFGRSRVQCK